MSWGGTKSIIEWQLPYFLLDYKVIELLTTIEYLLTKVKAF